MIAQLHAWLLLHDQVIESTPIEWPWQTLGIVALFAAAFFTGWFVGSYAILNWQRHRAMQRLDAERARRSAAIDHHFEELGRNDA